MNYTESSVWLVIRDGDITSYPTEAAARQYASDNFGSDFQKAYILPATSLTWNGN